MINFNKRQKNFIIGTISFVLIFSIFIVFSYFYANSNNIIPSPDNGTTTYNDIASASPASATSSEIETAENNTVSENVQNNTPNNENTNAQQENQSTNNDTSSNANTTGNSNSINGNTDVGRDNSTKVSPDNATHEDNSTSESYKYIITIQIKDVNSVLLSGTVKSNESLTAFEALELFAKESNFEVKKSGSGSLTYVTSINGLKEKGNGPSSGWMYKVNGAFPSAAAGKYTLNSGDILEWVYTHDGGKDVGSR